MENKTRLSVRIWVPYPLKKPFETIFSSKLQVSQITKNMQLKYKAWNGKMHSNNLQKIIFYSVGN